MFFFAVAYLDLIFFKYNLHHSTIILHGNRDNHSVDFNIISIFACFSKENQGLLITI